VKRKEAESADGSASCFLPDARADRSDGARRNARQAIPDLAYESSLWLAGARRVAGVDEAGRGPLAGPVVAAAVVLPPEVRPLAEVRDSKLLAPAVRESLLEEIRSQALAVGVGAASVGEIERLNVLGASYLAMRRALRRVAPVDHALVDGPRYRHAELGPHTPIVDGDALCYSIACASIIAKVARDRLMRKLAQLYPGYGWERNVGYGSAEHIAALRRLGPTPYHRRTFGPVAALRSSDPAGILPPTSGCDAPGDRENG
jgi:ribonuclease HII